MPTPEEIMSIKQAESILNGRVTDVGSGYVKVLGDIGTLQQVSPKLPSCVFLFIMRKAVLS